MVKFHGLCDGKVMVKKRTFFGFCVEMSFFCINFILVSLVEFKKKKRLINCVKSTQIISFLWFSGYRSSILFR